MKKILIILFTAIFLWMVGMTISVSLQKPLWQAGSEFSWKDSPWAVATLFDAYFGFLTFFVWVYFKEASWLSRGVWFVLIMSLGNIAMSGYLLLQLSRLKTDEPVANILMRTKQ